jgi:hypothetical protein
MNQLGLSLLIGLVAGAAGALGVHALTKDPSSSDCLVDAADTAGIHARLERIEAALKRGGLAARPTLRGTAPDAAGGALALSEAQFDALAARLEARLAPALTKGIDASVQKAMAGTDADWEEVPSGPEPAEVHGQKKATLAEAAAELGLTSEEEEAVRRITEESIEGFFKLLAGKDGAIADVKREFEDARRDPKLKAALAEKYMSRAMSDLGGLITLGLKHDRRMKEAIGPEKAARLERDFEVTDLDPYGLEDLFDFE